MCYFNVNFNSASKNKMLKLHIRFYGICDVNINRDKFGKQIRRVINFLFFKQDSNAFECFDFSNSSVEDEEEIVWLGEILFLFRFSDDSSFF